MQLFFRLSLISFRKQLAYRAAVFAGLATNLFFGILRAAVMTALYGFRTEVQRISLQGAVTFTGLSQAMIGFLSLFHWYDLMNNVYTGSISMDLLKPMGVYSYWLAQDFGRALAQFLLRGVPIMGIYALLFDITNPTKLEYWLLVLAACFLGWLVSFSWRFLVNLAVFWVPNAVGIGRFIFILSWFFSGFLIPLRYYPEWFARLCLLTPFPYSISAI